ncbi:hypothetical protein D0817_14985 [Flavobacterium cupreum]|uniref:Uncharacterized protein n=1 Tax=Flavobacterium cupreum TaxID=2133766 RepID=A0A434A5A6_9FLAO|nr:hypothetical protein D0817_14985 [Flavobacterium cupreum]
MKNYFYILSKCIAVAKAQNVIVKSAIAIDSVLTRKIIANLATTGDNLSVSQLTNIKTNVYSQFCKY